MMNVVYDGRIVRLHGEKSASVLLVNEAPGPEEAEVGLPLVGRQGGNLYRLLKKAEINWVVNWTDQNGEFVWPNYSVASKYSDVTNEVITRLNKRSDFMKLRKKFIACTNAYPQWPKSSEEATDFVDPEDEDVLSEENLMRLKKEVQSIKPSVLLICGEFSYLACSGERIESPSEHECSSICGENLIRINSRLDYDFPYIWYLGHTRRWDINQSARTRVLTIIKTILDW